MKILMLAPEPFFQPRGTPISVYFRIKALSALGHQVDLITYHLGKDKTFKNLRIFRIPNPFFIKSIKIGPSWKKLPLDFLLLIKTLSRLLSQKYDLIFSHEEAALFGAALGKIWRIPHVYDMHSSLPQQLENFDFSHSRLLKRIFVNIEHFILKNSQAVIVICPDLKQKVKKTGWDTKAVLLENILDFDFPCFSTDEISQKRREFASDNDPIVLYAGNFQPYQGISLLLEAAAQMHNQNAVFVLVGDTASAFQQMRLEAQELNISDKVHFTGQVDPALMPLYLAIADVLVSPRLSGTNTPLKIYSFLKTGKPVVATNLWTHTQILTEKISILVEPEAVSMAAGITMALNDREAQTRAQTARELAEREHTFPKYLEKIRQVLDKATIRSGKN